MMAVMVIVIVMVMVMVVYDLIWQCDGGDGGHDLTASSCEKRVDGWLLYLCTSTLARDCCVIALDYKAMRVILATIVFT